MTGDPRDPQDHRDRLRRLRILQHLGQVRPSPMGERALLNLLSTDPELEPDLDRVRSSLDYLARFGLVTLVHADHADWVAGVITDQGARWLDNPGDHGLAIYDPGYRPEVPEGSRGRVSSVARLPAETRAWIDQALIGRNFTGYTDLIDLLASQGLEISRSALGRYGKRLKARVAQYKEKAEVIRSLSDVFDDDAPAIMQGALGSALTAVMDAVEGGNYNADRDTLSSLVKSLTGIGRGLRDAERQRIEREVRTQAVEQAADVVEETARAQGLDEDQARFWREKFLKGM